MATTRRRTALVTGAGRGIGRSIALGLAAAGWNVLVADIGCQVDGEGTDASYADQTAREIISAGGDALAMAADVTGKAEVDAAVDAARERWGSVDALLNIAGILRLGNILTTSDDDWERILAVHIRGSFNTARAVVRHWVETGASYGRIINFTSAAGIEGVPDMLAYSTAKAGVIGMTLSLSNSLAHLGYTVNAVAPTGATRMAVRGLGDVALRERETTGAWPSLDERKIDPFDVVPLVLLLLSEDASTLTGRVLTNYGRTYALLQEPTPAVQLDGAALAPDEVATELVARFVDPDAPPARFRATSLPGADAYAFPVADLD
jgi:NAD(P)-dependent dehydrogenase (short-subunit alcohol dehydrogenase family)